MSKLLEKLMKSGSVKGTSVLSESTFFGEKDQIPTAIPALNIAFSGSPNGGMVSGLTVIAGPSRHFKSHIGLMGVKAYFDKYPDAVCLFYDSEFGITPEYLAQNGVDGDRMLHIPIEHIEQLKFDIAKRLEDIDRKDRVIIFMDSIGNLASKKEVEDALDGKSAADMTRAKQIKSLFRIVTPHLTTKDIPCLVINHTYETQEMFSKQVISGGCVVAGTKIQMADGTLKAVEEIKVGDTVITKYGDQPVTHTWNPDTLADGTPECYEIEFEDGSTVVCSDAHKFLVDGVWVEAEHLTTDMEVEII